jgi:hypothetical protein
MRTNQGALVDRVAEVRLETLRVVDDVLQLARECPACTGFAVATVLAQQIADDLANVQVLVGRPRPGPTLRLLDGGRG